MYIGGEKLKSTKEIAKRYNNIKQNRFPKEKDREFIRKFDRVLNKLNEKDKEFFLKSFLLKDIDDWWKNYYSKSTYYRMRNNVSEKFLIFWQAHKH